MGVTSLPRTIAGVHVREKGRLSTTSGSSTAQQDQVCRAHEEPVSTPCTFWEGSLQTRCSLLPWTEPPAAAGVHLGCSQGTFSWLVSFESKPGCVL